MAHRILAVKNVPVLVDSRGQLIAGRGRVLGDVKRRRNERGCP